MVQLLFCSSQSESQGYVSWMIQKSFLLSLPTNLTDPTGDSADGFGGSGPIPKISSPGH